MFCCWDLNMELPKNLPQLYHLSQTPREQIISNIDKIIHELY